MARRTLRAKIEERIAARTDETVFLPREFIDLSGYDQVLRALRQMVADKQLIRLGYGIYGKAFPSRISGKAILDSPNGLSGAARQALSKLGVAWEPTEAESAYNEGRTTQIPINPVLKVRERFSRRLSDGDKELTIVR